MEASKVLSELLKAIDWYNEHDSGEAYCIACHEPVKIKQGDLWSDWMVHDDACPLVAAAELLGMVIYDEDGD